MRLIKWKDCTQDNNISATGQRTAKHVYSSSDVFEHSDYYVYDASGNLMSVYRKFSDANEQVLSYSLTERPMYGSSRLGVDKTTIEFIGYTPPTNGLTNHVVGLKQYEGSNHLGNVLTTFSDKKMPVDANSDGIIDYSTANITSSTDYYPFGVTMKARDFTSNVSRFGFNGKEKDEETETMDFGARLLDGDLGVWLACDPLARKYPMFSSFVSFGNNPIVIIDKDGRDIKLYTVTYKEEYYYDATIKDFPSVTTAGLTNELTIQAMIDFMDTPEGYNYVAQFAKAGDVISIGDRKYEFKTDGVFKDQVLEVYDYVNMRAESTGAVAQTNLCYTQTFYNGFEREHISFPTDVSFLKDYKYKNIYLRKVSVTVQIHLYFAAWSNQGRAGNAITIGHEAFIHYAKEALAFFQNDRQNSANALNDFSKGDYGAGDHQVYLKNNNSMPEFMNYLESLKQNLGKNEVSKAKKSHDKDIGGK